MDARTLPDGPEDEAERLAARIPVRPEEVVRARALVARAAAAAALPRDRIDDLLVAVSEAVTNAIEAHLAATVTAPVEVRCMVDAGTFEVQVRDRGLGFAPDELAVRPPLSDPRHLDVERGWGIQLMRELVDEVVFDLTGRGTCVRLRVELDP